MELDAFDWKLLVKDLAPALLRYFRALFDLSQSEDLVQETLIRLLQKIEEGKFDSQRGNLRMYAFGIAHYVRNESYRLKEFEEIPEEISSEDGLEENFSEIQKLNRLREAISQLTDVQQQVIALYLDKELASHEIGAILDLPAATIRSHLHRAKQTLKEILTSEEIANE